MNRFFLTLFMIFSAVFSFSDASESKEALIQLLENTDTFSASFVQKTFTQTSASVEESEGLFWLERPLKFNWAVTKPFAQDVISDGETLWVYDPDLEQATYQAISDNLQQTPAFILTQPRESIGEQYRVIEAKSQTPRVFKLLPYDEEAVFSELLLIFQDNAISSIQVIDSLGQETVVEFADIKVNEPVASNLFEFIPPPGTDLFEQM